MNDYKKIEEFDETTLPSIDMDQSEKEEIKNKVTSVIRRLNKINKEVNIKISIDEALTIKNNLGGRERSIFGNQDAVLMREIMIKSIEEKENINRDDIVDELFIDIPAPNWWRSAAVCYKLYITKDKRLIVYALDKDCKIFSSYNVPLNEIAYAGEAGKAKCMMNENEQIIKIKDQIIYLYPDHGGKKEELMRFIKSLHALGVKDVDRSGRPWQFIFLKIISIIIVIELIWLVVSAIK